MFPRLFRTPASFRHRTRRRRIYTMFIALLTLLTFITPFYIIYKPPHALIKYFQRRWPDTLWHVPVSTKIIALSIDDAPSGYTTEILNVLAGYEAKATFFVIGGQVPGQEDVLGEIVKRGNELGNHAMHDEPSVSLAPAQLTAELSQVETYINMTYSNLNIPRPPNRLFRPGSGFFNARLRGQVKALGFRLTLGSVYPHDPQIPYAWMNARHVLSMVRPGSIIICHDRRSWTVPMLKRVLPELKRRGYRVVTVSELLEEGRGEGT